MGTHCPECRKNPALKARLPVRMLKEIKVSLKKYKNPKANNGINVAPTLVIFVLAVRIFRGRVMPVYPP
jgi:hypothetical protein